MDVSFKHAKKELFEMGLFVLLMGVQGAGKGEQARMITREYGIPHVSTGDLFRAMKTREDDFAKRIQATMASGQLIDDETTNQVVRERLEQPDAAAGAILDGYPRTPNQAQWLDSYLAQRGEHLHAAILLSLDPFRAFQRAFGRVSLADGSSYNFYSNRGELEFTFIDDDRKQFPSRLEAKHPTTGEIAVRRMDDANAHAVIKRIDTFLKETAPLAAYYRDKGLLRDVDAEQSIAAVSTQIRTILDAS
jgi:adenylate kinase